LDVFAFQDRLERVEEEDTAKAKEVRTILATKQVPVPVSEGGIKLGAS